MKRISILSFLFIMAFGIFVVGCSDSTDSTDSAGSSGDDESPETIKIGVIYPTSGGMASAGQDQASAVEFGAKIINESFDLDIPLADGEGLPNFDGAKIELIFADTEGEPEIALGAVEKLVTQDKVVAIIGSYASSNTAAASQAAERHGVPFLNAESTQRELTERGFTWFFRTMPHDYSFTENLFMLYDELDEEKGIKVQDIAIAYENTQFGQGSGEAQVHFAAESNREILADIAYAGETTDVTSEVLRVKDVDPDVLMMTSYVNDAILFQQTLKQQDYLPSAIIGMEAGHVDKDYVGVLGEDAEYILTSATWSADLLDSKPIVNEVNAIYKEETGKDLSGYIPHGITGMLVLGDAINRADSLSPDDVRDALLETDYPVESLIMPWTGVQFDSELQQNDLGSNVLLQIKDGEYNLVWPFDVATEELVWPIPAWDER